jgi:hypothetical protein
MWVLAGTNSVRTMTRVDSTTGAKLASVEVSNDASAILETTDDLLVGSASGTTSMLYVFTRSSGAPMRTVPLPASVIGLAAAANGTVIYVLEGTSTSRSVDVINMTNYSVERVTSVSSGTVSIAPTPDGSAMWTLDADGTLNEVSFASSQVVTSFSTGAPALSMALSPHGVMYVLRSATSTTPPHRPVSNVAVVNLNTESDERALPAPSDTIDIVISQDDRTLYDVVGTPAIGNVQFFQLTG